MFTIRNFSIFILILSFLSISCEDPEVKQKANSLRNIVIPVNSIDPANEDFSDLQFLKKIIEIDSVKIIMLGEQTHGDGSTFLAKSRLIKFLHKEAGFDVLAFESGLYDCTRAWKRIEKFGNYSDAIKKAVFPMWVKSNECRELIEYLQSTLTTSFPLELTGFDSQLSGFQSCNFLFEDFDSLKLNILSQSEKNLFIKIVCNEDEVFSDDKNNDCVRLLDKVCQHFDSLTASNNEINTQFWRNVLYGLKITYSGMYTHRKLSDNTEKLLKEQSSRDIHMGNNLIWLSDKKYKDRKIIVWAANFHIMRNFSRIDFPEAMQSVSKKTITMGDIIWNKIGQKIYSIIFTDFKSPANNNSIEYLLEKGGFKLSFINLRDTNFVNFIGKKFYCRGFGRDEFNGNWDKVADGIFFIRDIQKSNFQ